MSPGKSSGKISAKSVETHPSVKSLVSIGMPTFNRPEGLRRALSQLTNQSYGNLEILVSDNASPDEKTRLVTEDFMRHDKRVRYFRQPTNLGAAANFGFVLKEARGEFFMWAADDDEWEPEFVEKCLANIGSAASVVSGCAVLRRAKGHREKVAMPSLSPSLGTYRNLKLFLGTMAPGFIYGVHRRLSIQWVLNEKQFDWWDCYFVARQIAEGGFQTFPEILLMLGIDSDSYVVKPFDPGKGRLFRYRPFLARVGELIRGQLQLSLWQKLVLHNVMLGYMTDAFIQYEREARPRQVALVKKLGLLEKVLAKMVRRGARVFRFNLGMFEGRKIVSIT